MICFTGWVTRTHQFFTFYSDIFYNKVNLNTMYTQVFCTVFIDFEFFQLEKAVCNADKEYSLLMKTHMVNEMLGRAQLDMTTEVEP